MIAIDKVSGGTTNTTLQSPSFSTVGMSAATLTFYHYYRDWDTTDSAIVEISTNGVSWTVLNTYTTTQGANNNFALVTVSLNSYLNQTNVSIRFRYAGVWSYYWAIDNVTVTSTPNTPDLSYAWTSTPSGFTSLLQNPTGVFPTVNTTYTVTVTNNLGCSVTASKVEVIVDPTSVGGSVTGGTAICSGSTSGVLTLSGNTGNVVRWESAVSPFTTWNPIVNTSSTYTSGALTQTTQFRAVVQSGVCAEANSTPTTVSINTTTWTSASGGSWDNGAPTATTTAIIAHNYTSSGNLDACTLTVNNNAVVVISSGDVVSLSGGLTVDTGSTFTLENDAYLMQEGATNPNSGDITVERQSQSLMRLDYTLWSSPVESQNLLSFSPLTVTNRFYTYNTTADNYAAITPGTNDFVTGQGYLIRMPDNHPTSPTVWEGSFIGKPNSGDLTFSLSNAGNGFNAVGNPYPSPISIETFLDDNSSLIDGDLYFWRKTNNAAGSAYITYSGGAFSDGPHTYDNIQPGQGFIVKANSAGNLVFNNLQREVNTSVFYRSEETGNASRIWLHLKNNTNTIVGNMAVGYRDDATNDIDDQFDGEYINDSSLSLNSIVADTELAVQHRATFVSTDVVPLSFKTNNPGSFEIAINTLDGLFLNEEQQIFLKDNLLNLEHDLRNAAYSFVSEAGTFSNRFEIVYESTLSVSNPILENTVVVYSKNKTIEINSGSVPMNNVKVFDMRGRLVAEQKDVTATTISIPLERVANQVLIVQLTAVDGQLISKKVVH
ncbi:hypothetical protein [Flavobacterium sp.]|uniref:hypothetical protein n=1 Tax=Flavobacterium sp. TaxID=239 RepID=UPI0037BF3E7A